MDYTTSDTKTGTTECTWGELYWDTIPIGKENAISYESLCQKWHTNRRGVRRILHELSEEDNGDCLVLIRSSHGKGFYRSFLPEEIKEYKTECTNRAINTFAPLKKINRILKEREKYENNRSKL